MKAVKLWEVRREGKFWTVVAIDAQRAQMVVKTQEIAIERARVLAERSRPSRLLVRGEHGSIVDQIDFPRDA